jgi:hypothetical protein
MTKLKDELDSKRISNELFFVCADTKDAIMMRLADAKLSILYKAIGSREPQNMLPA